MLAHIFKSTGHSDRGKRTGTAKKGIPGYGSTFEGDKGKDELLAINSPLFLWVFKI